MVDIRELARRSGVSVATVSRALNGRPDVSAATRARIAELAEELGYRPSEAARALVRGTSDVVGLVWDTWYESVGQRHPFLAELLTGLKRALAKSGFHLMMLTRKDQAETDTYLGVARQHRLAAVLMMGAEPDDPAVRALLGSEVPCVGLDLKLEGVRTSYVTSSNEAGAAQAVSYLHQLGHTRIGTITGPLDLMPARQRLQGYRDQLARLGLPTDPKLVGHGDFFLSSGYQLASEMLSSERPPTALFVSGDEMAIGAMHAAGDLGRSVPGDLAIIGFDDIEAASLVRPALSTIAQDSDALATAAVELLAEMQDPAAAVTPRVVPTRLIPRATT